MIASILIMACSLISPHTCGQKNDGFAVWTHPWHACDQDGLAAEVTVSAEWPNFTSNRLIVSDFDAGSTAAGAQLCIRVRQDCLGGEGVYDLYIVPTIYTKGGDFLTLPVDGLRIPQDQQWTVLRFPITKPIADWSTTAVSWVVASSLLDAAGVDVDAVWVE